MITPGIQTSEFKVVILAIVGIVGGFLAAQGFISQDQLPSLTQNVSDIVTGIVAFLAIGQIAVSYINGRNQLKVAALTQPVVEQVSAPLNVTPINSQEVPTDPSTVVQ